MSLICLKNKQMDALKNAKKLHSVHAETRKQLGYVQNSETDIDILVDKLKSWVKWQKAECIIDKLVVFSMNMKSVITNTLVSL